MKKPRATVAKAATSEKSNETLIRLIRRHRTTLWGVPHFVTPRLVDWIHGDGLQVIYLTPLATRPNYYVVRIGSNIDLDNFSENEATRFCDAVLDNLKDEIEDQFGRSEEEWEHSNGRTYRKHNYFPAFNDSCGCAWGTIATLSVPDKRTELKLRKLILPLTVAALATVA